MSQNENENYALEPDIEHERQCRKCQKNPILTQMLDALIRINART